MAEPIPAQKAPYGVNVEAGKDYLVVRLRAQRQPALLRRLTQIRWLGATKIQRPSRLSKFGCAAVSPAPTSHSAMARIRAFE
jgi:hypothetical protein